MGYMLACLSGYFAVEVVESGEVIAGDGKSAGSKQSEEVAAQQASKLANHTLLIHLRNYESPAWGW